MMNKSAESGKAVIFLAILMTAGFSQAGHVYAVPESADMGINLQEDAPIYTGPFQEGDLEELTLEDFQEFGVEPEDPEDQYREYQKILENPAPGILVPYRLKILDRDLALEDFFGFNVPEELSQLRYDGYLSMTPVTADGQTIRYVYVYHSPMAGTEPGNPTN